MWFASLDEAAARLAAAVLARALPAPAIVLAVGDESRLLAEAVAAGSGAPVEVPRVERLPLPFYPRLAFGALAADGHHYADPVVCADHSLTAREIGRLCRARLPALRGRGWRRPEPLAGRSVVLVARALCTGHRALALSASARARGAGPLLLAAACGARDAIDRVEAAAPLVVLAASDGPRFDPDACFGPAPSA